jgi:hypothetical protein
MIKSVKILYNEKSSRFEADTLFTHDMGNQFVCGMISIENLFHTVHFKYSQE